jgi:tryptophanyl-tRNA synthetase
MNPHHQILAELKYYKDRSNYWRKEAGIFSCKVNKLGPTGGFCLDPDTKLSVGANNAFDKGLADEMSLVMLRSEPSNNVSVVDLGCGFGQYGEYFKKSSERIKWTGYDGSENIKIVTAGFVEFIDLAEPKFLGTNYDWAMSIEVAEHLPMQLESNFLYMLQKWAFF